MHERSFTDLSLSALDAHAYIYEVVTIGSRSTNKEKSKSCIHLLASCASHERDVASAVSILKSHLVRTLYHPPPPWILAGAVPLNTYAFSSLIGPR